jgi:hypothetical protein
VHAQEVVQNVERDGIACGVRLLIEENGHAGAKLREHDHLGPVSRQFASV